MKKIVVGILCGGLVVVFLDASWAKSFLTFCDFETPITVPLKLKDLYPYRPSVKPCRAPQPAPGQPIMNVFVHGTAIAQAPASRTALVVYPGLHKFDPNQTDTNITFPAALQNIYRIAMTNLSKEDPTRFPPDSLYLYGWSGYLSPSIRLQEAALLYYRILEEIRRIVLIEEKPFPFVRIITHSHGGNIALNLSQYKNCFPCPFINPDDCKRYIGQFNVDDMILLACPVQDFTSAFISDSMFLNVTTFSSPNDFVQIYDPQDLFLSVPGKKLYSTRVFPGSNTQNANIAQIKLIINRGTIQHIDFVREKVIFPLPGLLDQVDQLKQPGEQLFATLEIFV